MTYIHVDPVQLYEAATRIDFQILDLWDQAILLRRSASILEMNWSGPSADGLIGELRSLIVSLTRQIEDLDYLRIVLRRQASMWEESDLDWQNRYSELGFMEKLKVS